VYKGSQAPLYEWIQCVHLACAGQGVRWTMGAGYELPSKSYGQKICRLTIATLVERYRDNSKRHDCGTAGVPLSQGGLA